MGAADRPAARRFLSTSPEATEALGEGLGRVLPPGSVLALDGELGAGKTTLVRGLARGLGLAGGVASPSYTLMTAHEGGEGRLPLYHYDAWMEGREKALLLDGGDEWLGGEGVCAVEWASRVSQWLPTPRLEVDLTHAGVHQRVVWIRWVGPEVGGGPALRSILEDLVVPEGVRDTSPPL